MWIMRPDIYRGINDVIAPRHVFLVLFLRLGIIDSRACGVENCQRRKKKRKRKKSTFVVFHKIPVRSVPLFLGLGYGYELKLKIKYEAAASKVK